MARAQPSRVAVTYRCAIITSTDKPRPKNAITANVSMLITSFLSVCCFRDLRTRVDQCSEPDHNISVTSAI